ncbi:ABC transporter ATP-binding protein [Bacillus sp. FJAT-29814]|uniref:ABC transporter ATP-binding protein n=1 Tax=Bacillus sp. FJAT-29814 TaxID=1729688 RepID=UPI000A54378B|nr:energy-coupling factor transporter ATPase [Bacillus sp. FJAT-29814]
MMHSKPLVEVKDVSFQYPGSETRVLNGVSLTVEEGEFLAIIGGNGSGKSTLCKTLNGLIPKFYVGEFEGEVVVDGLDTSKHDVADLSKTVGYVYQDFEKQLLRPTVLDDASFVPLNYGLWDFKERGKWALEVTGLSHLANAFVWQLSGGQKHLLALAGAIAMKPKLLIVDEPVAQLDPQHASRIYDVLKKLNEEYGTTIITIEHHTEFIAKYCNKVVLMDQGEMVWKKDVRDALCSVDDLVTRQIHPPQVTMAAYHINRDGNYPITLEEAIKHFRGKVPALYEHPFQTKTDKSPILSLQNITVQYQAIHKEMKKALKNLSARFYKGDKIALVGNNGSGKSSLLKVIGGIVKPKQGTMELVTNPLPNYSPETLSSHVAFVFQNPEEMFIDDSVRKEIEYYLKARKVHDYTNQVDQILVDFDLTDLQHQDARLLSGGQQRRVSLAIGAAIKPSVIILDEPTANLDIATKNKVLSMFNRLEAHVDTIIIATHDMQLVSEWAERVLVMNDGQLIADDASDVIFRNEEILQCAGLVPPQIITLCNELHFPHCPSIESFVEYWNLAKERGA